MAVSFPKAIFFVGALVATNACAQSNHTSEENQYDVRKHLINEVASDLVNLENTIDGCDTHARSRGAIQMDDDISDGSEAVAEQWVLGISHLYFNNLFECERSARERLAFSLGTLRSLSPPDEEFPDDIESISAGLLYPTEKQLEYAVKYQSLPQSVRSALEKQIGDEPFGLMNTLDENGLLHKP